MNCLVGILCLAISAWTTEGLSRENRCPDPTYFDCGWGVCIAPHRVCDTHNDCYIHNAIPDEYDGAHCPSHEECNGINQFKCDDGDCIGAMDVCDGREQCQDGSDERQDCSPGCTGPHKFQCDSPLPWGKDCIAKRLVCNGRDDCPDGEDEAGCPGLRYSVG